MHGYHRYSNVGIILRNTSELCTHRLLVRRYTFSKHSSLRPVGGTKCKIATQLIYYIADSLLLEHGTVIMLWEQRLGIHNTWLRWHTFLRVKCLNRHEVWVEFCNCFIVHRIANLVQELLICERAAFSVGFDFHVDRFDPGELVITYVCALPQFNVLVITL